MHVMCDILTYVILFIVYYKSAVKITFDRFCTDAAV